jgi:glyoxylase-like metal-dependent hydrolase (beta-lactamase superfamily II)
VSPDPSIADDWTAPGTFEVAPDVFRVPLPLPNDGLKAVNVYVLRNASGDLTLIDSGWAIPEARDRLLTALDKLGHGPSDIRRFLVTHMHRDHYTLGVALRREFGTTVAVGAGEQASLQVILSPERLPFEQELDRMRAFGADVVAERMRELHARHQPPAENPWETPDEWLTPGTVEAAGRSLDVVATPGHTRGHVVFHDTSASLLFAGDHVLPTITPSIGLEPALSPNPLGDFLDSLTLVRSRPDAMLLPAHGPVAASVHARVDELTAHHGRRLDEVEAAVRRGATTAYDVARQLRWTRRGRSLDELDVFNQMLAIGETGAHLELLVVQGRLHAVDDDGVRHYDAS